MGIVYSVVLEVVEQYGLEQRTVAIDSWEQLLTLAQTSEDDLRRGDVDANHRILDLLLDGQANGTGIPLEENVYVDLAINPINRACWVVNRRITTRLPDDANPLQVDFDTYFSSATQMLSRNAEATSVYHGELAIRSGLARRIHDFLFYGTSDADLPNNIGQIQKLLSFITSRPPILATALATINVQAVLNTLTRRHQNRGHQFLADLLDTVLHALQGTGQGQVSTTTGISYQVGAIGWPNDGVPGRAIEVALHPDVAFTYLQKTIFDLVLDREMTEGNKPLAGYISIRICPQTRTFMGMQQFEPFSVMVELVGFRTPEANAVMDMVQTETLRLNREEGLNAMLHWGLENDQLVSSDLERMPITRPLSSNPGISQLLAFIAVKQFFLGSHPAVFDNNFVRRLLKDVNVIDARIDRLNNQIVIEVKTRIRIPGYDRAMVLLVEQDGDRDNWETITRVEEIGGISRNIIDFQNASFPDGVNTAGPEDDVGGTGVRRRMRLVTLSSDSDASVISFNFLPNQPDTDPELEFYAVVAAVAVENNRPVALFGGLFITETIRVSP
jgi:hypothetical protein